MKRIAFTLSFFLIAASGCVRGPYHISSEKRFTDTYWLGLSGRIVQGSSLTVKGETLYFGTRRGTLYAVDAKSGKTRWKSNLIGGIDSTPQVSGDRLYVGTSEGNVYAMDATSGSTLWKTSVNGEIMGPCQVFHDQLVLAGSNDGFLYAFDVRNGEQRWRYRRDLPDRITIHGFALPAVTKDKIYAAFADGSISSIQGDDGTELWNQKLTSDSRFPDVVSPILLASNQIIATQYFGTLYALDPSGQIRWSVPQAGAFAKVIQSNGTIYSAGAEGQVQAIDEKNGKVRWTFSSGHSFNWSGLALKDQHLFVSSFDGELLILDRDRGDLVWKYVLGSAIQGSPVIVDDSIFAITQRGTLFQLTLNN